MKTKRFTLIVVSFVLLVSIIACATFQPQPTSTPVPTNTQQPTYAPIPTETAMPIQVPSMATPSGPMLFNGVSPEEVLRQYGYEYVGDESLGRCSSPCRAYANQEDSSWAVVYTDGSMGLGGTLLNGVGTSNQFDLVIAVILNIFGQDMANWYVRNHLEVTFFGASPLEDVVGAYRIRMEVDVVGADKVFTIAIWPNN